MLSWVWAAAWASPMVIPVQGLLESPGTTPPTGSQTLHLRLTADEAGASVLCDETLPTQLVDGLFSVRLGGQCNLDTTAFAALSGAWLSVGLDTLSTPVPVGWAPFAARAASAAAADLAANASALGGAAPSAYTLDTETIAWSRLSLTGAPALVTNGLSVSGSGLQLTGTTLSLTGGGGLADLATATAVGVGRTNPAVTLDVAGPIRAIGDATCAANTEGAIRWDSTANQLLVCDGVAWRSVYPQASTGRTQAEADFSCKTIKSAGLSTGDGLYWIDPDGGSTSNAFQAWCEMDVDGGGWTMVAYAGTITGSKTATVGSSFQPLFFNFGTYDPNANTTRTPFSRPEKFPHILVDNGEFMATRTTVPSKIFIWPVVSAAAWRTTRTLPVISYIKLSNDGGTTLQTRTNNLTIFDTSPAPNYTGYNWNTPQTENCDNCGRSYTTALNHRSLLYWEALDSSPYQTQWFHGSPLTLTDATGPVNNVQDIAIYVREGG